MSFINNNTEYGILSDNEISSVIGNFSSDMIYDIVETRYQNRFRPYQLYVGNLIIAINQDFQSKLMMAPQLKDELMQSRQQVFSIILEKICALNGLSINNTNLENIDLYSLDYFLYDFFISRCTLNIVNFFANFIIKEQDSLIEMINIIESKKSNVKDTGFNYYSKKLFHGNNNLALIHANLEKIITNICGMDIDMPSLIQIATYDTNIVNLICGCTSEITNVFQTQFVPWVKEPTCRSVILTMIRLKLQELSAELSVTVV